MNGTHGLLSLLPAVVTILVALRWRRVSAAIGAGVLVGALVLGAAAPLPTLKALGGLIWTAFSDLERLKIVLFILLVGGLLEVMAVSGAYQAFAAALGQKLSNARRTRLATWGLSALLFFDDYANVLITGSALRGLAHRNRVRPALMAYLVDVVAVLASVMVLSTWAAFEGNEMYQAAQGLGLNQGPTGLFLASFPFHFYTFLAIFLSFLVALTGRWFGAPFDTHHFLHLEAPPEARGARAAHVAAPFATLVLGALLGMLLAGTLHLRTAGEAWSFVKALQAAPTVDVLILSTLAALGLALFLFRRDGVLGIRAAGPAFSRGVRDMLEIALIILLAGALSRATTQLGAGPYLAGPITRLLPAEALPVGVFALAALVTVATGFSWGAMAIVTPVAFSLVGSDPARLVPVLGAAVITGAVSGEHLIPYSEKAVLSATACGIPPLYHWKTQVAQSLSAFLAGGLGFLLLGRGWPLWACYLVPGCLLALAHLRWARPTWTAPTAS